MASYSMQPATSASASPIDLSYRLSGDPSSQALPIVLIHGYGSSKETWKGLMSSLPHHTCYALDLRGHGHSQLGDESTFSFENVARDIVAFCHQHEIKQALFVAHSMGAKIAVAAAALDPELCKGLLLMDMEMKPHETQEVSQLERERLQAFERTHHNVDKMRAYLKEYGYSSERIEGFLKEGRIQKGEKNLGDEAFHVWVNPYVDLLARTRISSACQPEHYFQVLAKSNKPIWLLKAERESEVSEEGLAWMQQTYPNMHLERLSDCDHRIQKTALGQLVGCVERFYQQCTQ